MKLRLIKALDWFDDRILAHRAYTLVPGYPGGLCHFIATSSWWVEVSHEEQG
jgi:hypothetical protein